MLAPEADLPSNPISAHSPLAPITQPVVLVLWMLMRANGAGAGQFVAFNGLAAAPELARSQYQARLGDAGR
jgi:hypothetical protein